MPVQDRQLSSSQEPGSTQLATSEGVFSTRLTVSPFSKERRTRDLPRRELCRSVFETTIAWRNSSIVQHKVQYVRAGRFVSQAHDGTSRTFLPWGLPCPIHRPGQSFQNKGMFHCGGHTLGICSESKNNTATTPRRVPFSTAKKVFTELVSKSVVSKSGIAANHSTHADYWHPFVSVCWL